MSARNARDLAYHTVRSRIITMELKPGDPLNDRELAEELGISRTPMREALILLNNAHMVAIKPQSGTHVAPIDLHLMELEQFSRYTLEKEILTRMCGRLTPEQEAGYRQLIEAYRVLEASPEEPDREMRLLELDKAPQMLTQEDLRYIASYALMAASLSTERIGGIPSIPAKREVLAAIT